MKTNEYIQCAINAILINKKLDNLFQLLPAFDEIRKLHLKFQNQLETLLIDPHTYEQSETREKIKSRAIEIREICNEFKIQVNFNKLPHDFVEFSNQFRYEKQFAIYSYNQINITDLIVFVHNKKEKTKKKNESIEELRNAEFIPNPVILNEHENDINTLPGGY